LRNLRYDVMYDAHALAITSRLYLPTRSREYRKMNFSVLGKVGHGLDEAKNSIEGAIFGIDL
jgi:hypothetical protein